MANACLPIHAPPRLSDDGRIVPAERRQSRDELTTQLAREVTILGLRLPSEQLKLRQHERARKGGKGLLKLGRRAKERTQRRESLKKHAEHGRVILLDVCGEQL